MQNAFAQARQHPYLTTGLVVVGLGIGTLLGFLADYFGRWVDTLIKGAADVLLTIAGLLFLVVIASSIRTAVSVDMMALVIAIQLITWEMAM